MPKSVCFLYCIGFVSMFFGTGFALAKDTGNPTVNGYDLFQKIGKSRQSIQTGHLQIQTTVVGDSPNPIVWQWTIYFDGSKKRADVIRNGNTDVICQDCYGKSTRLYYTTTPPPVPDGEMSLAFYDGYSQEIGMMYVPDPRWMAYLPMDLVNMQHLHPLVMYDAESKHQEKSLNVVSDTLDGVPCWRIDFVRNAVKIDYSLWLAQSDTDRVVASEGRFTSDAVQYVDRVLVEDKIYKGSIRFPAKLHYKRTENGKVTRSAETVINVVSLNEPLPANTFSPKGISFLKPDTPVAWHLERDRPFPDGELVWDGENVVQRDRLGQMMKESRSIGTINLVLMLLGIGLIFTAIGLALYKKYVRR